MSENKSKDMITPLKDAGTYSVDVTDPTGITLSKDSITLAVGEQERLQPTVTPVDQVLPTVISLIHHQILRLRK